MIVTYLALAQLGVALFFKPQGGRSLARAIGRRERRIMRTASRWNRLATPRRTALPDRRDDLHPGRQAGKDRTRADAREG